MSSLKKLVVKRMQQAENVLELLAIIIQSSQRTPLFLPHLETLSYSGPLNVAHVDISSDRIYFLITLPSLRLVTFDIYPYIPKNAIPFLLGLMEWGVTVKVWSLESQDALQSSIDCYKARELEEPPCRALCVDLDWVDILNLSLMQYLSWPLCRVHFLQPSVHRLLSSDRYTYSTIQISVCLICKENRGSPIRMIQ